MSSSIIIIITPEEGNILPLVEIIRERLRSSPIFRGFHLNSISRENDHECYAILLRTLLNGNISSEFAAILNDRANFIELYYFIESRINPMMIVRILSSTTETNNGNSTPSTSIATPVVFGGFGFNPSAHISRQPPQGGAFPFGGSGGGKQL